MKNENTLIDRYIHEVGQRLPKKLRDDIKLELRSALQDMLDERKLDTLSTNDEDAISQMLIEFGRPEKVASGYLPKRSVIGPQLYHPFIMALKIAGAVLVVLTALGLSLEIVNDGISIQSFIQSVAQLYGNLIQMLGVVLIVFLVLERAGAGKESEKSVWDPRKLPKIDDPARLKRTESIVSIIFSVVALIIFNFYPEIIAVYGSVNGQWGAFALLAPEFAVHIPWLSAMWGLEIAMRTELLRQGRWNSGLRFAEFLLSLFGLFVLYRVIIGGPILTMSTLSWLVKGALSIALVVTVIKAVGQAYRLLIPSAKSTNPLTKAK
jgi:hypothetical protein